MKTPTLLALGALILPAAALAETATVDGHDIWYQVDGDLSGGATPILLLHGGMMNSQMMLDALAQPLAADHPIISIDQQGHGYTADYQGGMTLATMRADTLGVLDALQVTKAHVIGFSMGGMLGLELAANAPDRVASLTAISASQNKGGMLPELMQMNTEPGFQPSPEVAALLPSPEDFEVMAKGFAEQNPGGAEAMQVTLAETGALITSDWGWGDEALSAIDLPVQIVMGDKDFITRDHGVHLAGLIPDAWLGVLPDTTHMSILGHPALPGLLLKRIETAN